MIAFINYFFIDTCRFSSRSWLSISSLNISYISLYLLLVIPLFLQLILQNKLGWIIIFIAYLIVLTIMFYDDYMNPFSELKSGIIGGEFLQRKEAIIDYFILIGLLILFAFITFPTNRKYKTHRS